MRLRHHKTILVSADGAYTEPAATSFVLTELLEQLTNTVGTRLLKQLKTDTIYLVQVDPAQKLSDEELYGLQDKINILRCRVRYIPIRELSFAQMSEIYHESLLEGVMHQLIAEQTQEQDQEELHPPRTPLKMYRCVVCGGKNVRFGGVIPACIHGHGPMVPFKPEETEGEE